MDPRMLALLQGKYGGVAPEMGPGGGLPPELMGGGPLPPEMMGGVMPQGGMPQEMMGMSPEQHQQMMGGVPPQEMMGGPLPPEMMMSGMPPQGGPGGIPVDMATGGPMAASPLATTDPGQMMALISQMASADQQKAVMEALANTKLAQAQAIQPVAAQMMQMAMAQGATMDVGGGPVGGF